MGRRTQACESHRPSRLLSPWPDRRRRVNPNLNTFLKAGGVGSLLVLLPDLIPADYLIYPAWLIVGCAVLRAVIQPPAATSRWAPLYELMSATGGCIGWAIPRLRPGITAVPVAREDAAKVKAAIPEILSKPTAKAPD
ncbi:hypothetical protein HKD27_05750 [Gluconobacter sp. R75690]|nr:MULTISPECIES: hypothetical protein [unclassified Gluconobacter]MBF0850428.1 hypothetical protein [Gluconobacter sp. R75690]MBF0879120.1 hypothetical protein [Gluconobacter sp. R75828]